MWLDDEKGTKPSRLEAIWYRMEDWDAARRFYREVLGLKERFVDEGAGEAQFSTDAGPALYLVRAWRIGQRASMPVVGLRFDELETLYERLTAADVEVDVRRGESGITRLAFSDPDSHRFEAYRWEIKDAVKPAAVQGVVTDNESRVLLVLVGNRWTLPGGVVDDGEGPLETLEREFLEEVGFRPLDPQLSGVYHSLPWDGLRLVFHCGATEKPRPGAEVRACEFVDVERLEKIAPPWILDRVLDVFEFGGRTVVRTQRTDSPSNYISARPRRHRAPQ